MMKVMIKKKGLREALIALSKVVPGKPSLPVLGGVMVEVGAETASLTVTNLEEVLTWRIDECSGEGVFIVDFKQLKEFVSKGGVSEHVEFTDEDGKVKAAFDSNGVKTEVSLESFSREDWPGIPSVNAGIREVCFSFFESIRKAAPSVSKDASRGVMRNVLIEKGCVVATNGSQLVKFECATGVECQCLLPTRKFISSKQFVSGDGRVAVDNEKEPGWIAFQSGAWRYALRLSAGSYPDYTRVIPKTSNTATLDFSIESMTRLKEALPLVREDGEYHTVHLYADGSKFMVMPGRFENPGVSVEYETTNTSKRELLAVSVDKGLLGRMLELGLSRLKLTDGNTAGPLTATSESGDTLFMFMPLRGGNPENIKKAVAKFRIAENSAVVPDVKDVSVGSAAEREKNVCDGEVRTVNKKENASMTNETGEKGFKVTGEVNEESKVDTFDDLITAVGSIRLRAKELSDELVDLQKRLKESQSLQRQKERDFKSARELLGKLKKVSGF